MKRTTILNNIREFIFNTYENVEDIKQGIEISVPLNVYKTIEDELNKVAFTNISSNHKGKTYINKFTYIDINGIKVTIKLKENV